MTEIVVENRFAGPPAMGHGGYVAGLFATRVPGAVQATLRRPIPVDTALRMAATGEGVWELRNGADVIADGRPSELVIDVPAAPSIEDARRAESGSPSYTGDRGVHPTCFGCGMHNEQGLRIAAGPTADGRQVAAAWTPAERLAGPDGMVDPHFVIAALDCAGAFAFIVDDIAAGLLGRLVFERYAPVPAGVDHVVTGWQIGIDGRKMFAGTALASDDGTVLAAAKATWFSWN